MLSYLFLFHLKSSYVHVNRIYGRLEFFFSTRIKIELNTINFAEYSGLNIDMHLQGNKI